MWTSQKYLKDLYSGNHKLILATSETKTLNFLTEIKNIQLFQYNKAQKAILPFPNCETSDLIEITLAPSFILGFLVASDQGKEEINSLREWWINKVPSDQIPPLLELTQTNNPDHFFSQFWHLLFNRLSSDNINIAQRLTTLQKQYFQLRQLYENTQNAFSAIENYLSQAQLPPLQLSFENPPSKEIIAPPDSGKNYSCEQLLPLPSRGLAMIELYLTKCDPRSVGHLIVSVAQIDDDSLLGKWRIPYENLSEGWLSLDLPHIDIKLENDIRLNISWQTITGNAPSLGLGDLQILPQFKLSTEDNSFNYSLALRLWTGLPGSRKSFDPYAVALLDNDQIIANYGYLGQGTLARLVAITPNHPDESFEHIRLSDDGNKIFTHPRGDKLSIAMLPFSFPPGATYLTATVTTEHEEASIIEYGLALIDDEMDPETCLGENSCLAFSGWRRVEPNSPRQLKLSIAPASPQYYHIVLATRLPQNGHPRYAWCYWHNFLVESESPKIRPLPTKVKVSLPLKTTDRKTTESRSNQIKTDQSVMVEKQEDSEFHPPVITKPKYPLNFPFYLGKKVLSKFMAITPNLPSEPFEHIRLIDGKIFTHPRGDQLSIAMIPLAFPPGATHLDAEVKIDHEEAHRMEYGMALISQDMNPKTCFADNSHVAFSGWQMVKPTVVSHVQLSVQPSEDQYYHIVLATRLPPNGHLRYAWCYWLNFKVDSKTGN